MLERHKDKNIGVCKKINRHTVLSQVKLTGPHYDHYELL